MNPQGPHGIEYLTKTWNPVTGCRHQKTGVCTVNGCWAHNMASRNLPGLDDMTPRFHRDRLQEPLSCKKSQRIGVTFYGDLWGDWVSETWINAVLEVCREASWHKFIFLTKNPRRYGDFEIPENCWCGTSITADGDWERADTLSKTICNDRLFLSLEPFTGWWEDWARLWFEWIIIGGKSGKGKGPVNRDTLHAVRWAIYDYEYSPSLFVKSNAVRDPDDALRIQQYPSELLLPGEK